MKGSLGSSDNFGPLPAPHIAELADMPKLLTFAEIEAGQRALERFDGDALAAIEAGDALFTLLLVTARARDAGLQVPELFTQAHGDPVKCG